MQFLGTGGYHGVSRTISRVWAEAPCASHRTCTCKPHTTAAFPQFHGQLHSTGVSRDRRCRDSNCGWWSGQATNGSALCIRCPRQYREHACMKHVLRIYRTEDLRCRRVPSFGQNVSAIYKKFEGTLLLRGKLAASSTLVVAIMKHSYTSRRVFCLSMHTYRN